MSATPGANTEYSRGSGDSGRGFGGDSGNSGLPPDRRTAVVDRGAGGLILAGALLAALLLIVAEFTSLYDVHIATTTIPIKSVSGGSNHSYAMLVIGAAAGLLGIGVWRSGSRPALLALGVLGIVALVIALAGDLPDAEASGIATRQFVLGKDHPSAGLYLETLGAVLLIATSGLGFLMLGVPPPRRRRPADDGPRDGANGRSADGAPAEAQAWSRRRRGGEDPDR